RRTGRSPPGVAPARGSGFRFPGLRPRRYRPAALPLRAARMRSATARTGSLPRGLRAACEVRRSDATADFHQPPAEAHEQETPVLEELRRLAFEGMPDELQDPAH